MAPRQSPTRQIDEILKTARGKSYAVTGVTVLLVVLIVLVGIFPAVSAILFQISENNSRREALEQVLAKRETLIGLVQEEEQKRAISVALNSYLPNNIGQEGIYELVAEVQQQVPLQVQAVRFTDLDDSRRLSSVFKADVALAGAVVNISLRGSRENILEFADLLEDSYRIVNITSLTVFSDENLEEESGDFRAEIAAEFYYWETAEED